MNPTFICNDEIPRCLENNTNQFFESEWNKLPLEKKLEYKELHEAYIEARNIYEIWKNLKNKNFPCSKTKNEILKPFYIKIKTICNNIDISMEHISMFELLIGNGSIFGPQGNIYPIESEKYVTDESVIIQRGIMNMIVCANDSNVIKIIKKIHDMKKERMRIKIIMKKLHTMIELYAKDINEKYDFNLASVDLTNIKKYIEEYNLLGLDLTNIIKNINKLNSEKRELDKLYQKKLFIVNKYETFEYVITNYQEWKDSNTNDFDTGLDEQKSRKKILKELQDDYNYFGDFISDEIKMINEIFAEKLSPHWNEILGFPQLKLLFGQ